METMPNIDSPLADITPLLNKLAQHALSKWDLPPNAQINLINISENMTYLVEAKDGFKSILRVHRAGYHTKRAINSEILWSTALSRETDILIPNYIPSKEGEYVETLSLEGLNEPRFVVMIEFFNGHHPSETGDLTSLFLELGKIAAQTHLHATNWKYPPDFERFSWDIDAVFGQNALWGNWRDAPNISTNHMATLEAAETLVTKRLKDYGFDQNRFGLIHGDMRLANLLINQENKPQLIDFDDCGFGWFLYEFAAAISFIEDHPQIPQLKNAWLQGYQSIRPLSKVDIDEIDSFIMFRRFALLAWIGSHIEAPEPQKYAPNFAKNTAKLAKNYLNLHD